MIAALKKEIRVASLRSLNAKNGKEIIETIYFGGGTPSLLSIDDLQILVSAIKDDYSIFDDPEFTIEANPDDIDDKKLSAWKAAGINRLSIGIQSFKKNDLVWMNRAHNVNQALHCITLTKEAGFNNFSVDLIYGTPGLTDEEWQTNVKQIINSEVPHVACYALTVEPKTALQKMIALDKKTGINTDDQARQFLLLIKWMKEAGYEHYEISNFAKPGFRSKHNSSYWQGKNYVGIGPSAHSYDGISRKWNVANNALYIESIKKDQVCFEQEILSNQDRLNEYVMTSLRTMDGLDLNIIENNFSRLERMRIENAITKYVEKKLVVQVDKKIILTNEGKLFADGIASDLFVTDKILQ